MFRLVNQKSVVQSIREQILDLISEGKLVPGVKLPSEKELMIDLGVSRPALREALRMMIGEDLLEVKPGLGTYVKQPTSATAIQTEIISLLLKKEDLNEIMEVRRILEPEIAAKAAKRATDEDIKNLEKLLDEIEESIRKEVSTFDQAWTFHRILAQAAANQALTKIAEILFEMIKTYEQPLYDDFFDPLKELIEHREILHTIKTGDCNRARSVMLAHLDYVEKCIENEN